MFDGTPKPPSPGTVVPGNRPQRPNIGDFKTVWYLDQLYDPDVHPVESMTKYIVPYEGEIFLDTKTGKNYIVTHVDEYNTWKSTLIPYTFLVDDGGADYNLFPKHEYGFLQGELGLLIDYSVRPNVARVDANATAPDAAYGIVYLGSIVGDPIGEKISAIYSAGELITNRIPVSSVVFDNYENKTIMGVDAFSILLNEEKMKNGTRATLVYYDIDGRPIPPTYPLAVQHSAYLRDHQLSKRYITRIELLSPWFTNSTKPNTLFIPINVPLTTVQFSAKVWFSDGDSLEMTVNSYDGNTGFNLYGIAQFKPTQPGQISDEIVLTYMFKEHEQASIAQPGSPRHMSESYEIVAKPAEGAYSTRVYTYPYWDSTVGWKLRHFTTDLERKYCRDVTNIVTLNNSSPVFDGRKYGEIQPMIFNLNMRDVNPIYEPWQFNIYSNITLYNSNVSANRKWDVQHSKDLPAYMCQTINFVEQVNNPTKAKFVDFTTIEEFLKDCYYAFEPMFDIAKEEFPLVPTHFDLVKHDGTSITGIPVGKYNDLPITGFGLINGETLFIRWVQRTTSGNELQLGVSAAILAKVTQF